MAAQVPREEQREEPPPGAATPAAGATKSGKEAARSDGRRLSLVLGEEYY